MIRCFVAALFLCSGTSVSFSQPPAKGAFIAYDDGQAHIDGLSHFQLGSVLPANSTVRTSKGRVGIRFGGDTLLLDEHSSARFVRNPFINSDWPEILTGSAVIVSGELGPAILCEQRVQLSDSGFFRFDVHFVGNQRFCRLRVYEGAATAQMPSFAWVLTRGKTIDLNPACGDHTQRNRFNVDTVDNLVQLTRQLILDHKL